MAANRAEFLANCGSRLDHSKAVTAWMAITLGPSMGLDWTGSKGRATANQGRCPLGSCISSKVFYPLTQDPDFPSSLSICPRYTPGRQGKGGCPTIHNFHVIILSRSCISRSGGGGQEVAGSVPDLFMTYTLSDSGHLCSNVFGMPLDRSRS
jgi:hypothetical protein